MSGSAGVWQDQQVRAANQRAGWTLCDRCEGTGNELYSMYRACSGCGGSGHIGDTPWRVRLSGWWRRKVYTWRGRDWGPWLTGHTRWFLSYYLGIGQWFRDAKDNCHRCDALPSDIDYEIRRVGPRRAECIDREMCDEAIRDYEEFAHDQH